MIHASAPQNAMSALRSAFPYLRIFQGKTFVIKAGGEAFQNPSATRAFLEQISIVHRLGIRLVLVHGGGPQIDSMSVKLGLTPKREGGRRITDPETLDVATMVLGGKINTRLVATFRSLETKAVGISGVDGELISARRRPPVPGDEGETVDFGEVGDVVSIDTALIDNLLDNGFLPVIHPLCADESGVILNVNADSVASRLATALNAAKLIFMTSTQGILLDPNDPSSLLSYTDRSGLLELRDRQAIKAGMLPKVASILEALDAGIPRVHVISHKSPDSLLLELFTNEGSGTLVVEDTQKLRPEEVAPSANATP